MSIRTHPRYHHLHQNSVDESGNASGMSGAGSSTGGIGGAVGGIGINLGSPSSVMSSELGGVALCSFTDQFWEKARAQISPRVQAWLNRKLKAKITKYVKLPGTEQPQVAVFNGVCFLRHYGGAGADSHRVR